MQGGKSASFFWGGGGVCSQGTPSGFLRRRKKRAVKTKSKGLKCFLVHLNVLNCVLMKFTNGGGGNKTFSPPPSCCAFYTDIIQNVYICMYVFVYIPSICCLFICIHLKKKLNDPLKKCPYSNKGFNVMMYF